MSKLESDMPASVIAQVFERASNPFAAKAHGGRTRRPRRQHWARSASTYTSSGERACILEPRSGYMSRHSGRNSNDSVVHAGG